MNKKNIFGKWMLLIIAIALVANTASALSITPGRTTLDFAGNMEKEVQFTLINSQHRDMKILLTVEGELADSIKLKEHLLEFKADEEQKVLSYKLKLPEKIATPGDHMAQIVATEAGEGVQVGSTSIIASTAVATQLIIRVPYPGKYVGARLEISEGNTNEEMIFVMPVHNFGEDKIAKATSTIEITDKDKKNIATLNTEISGIEPKQTKELITSWIANAEPGAYHATATIKYDGNEIKVEKDFNIGSMFIDLKAVTVKNFNLGSIAKFNILIENKWSEDVKDLYAELVITNELGDVLADVKSATAQVNAGDEAVLDVFWDTDSVTSGNYNMRVMLHYSGRSTEKLMKSIVSLNSITNSFAGTATANVVRDSGSTGLISKGSSIFMLVAVGIIVILVAVKVISGMRKKKKR